MGVCLSQLKQKWAQKIGAGGPKFSMCLRFGFAISDREEQSSLYLHLNNIIIPATMSITATTKNTLQVEEEKDELVGGKSVFVVVLLFPCLVLIIIVLNIVSTVLFSKLNIFCQPPLHKIAKWQKSSAGENVGLEFKARVLGSH